MAIDGLKDFTINWVVMGLLGFCLLAFAIGFMYENNPTNGLNDGTGDKFSTINHTLSNQLIESPKDANTLLNITANTNPEASDLGSRDSVSSSFGAFDSAKSFFQTSKELISWVFIGPQGQLLLGVFAGLIGLLAFFYITKLIRLGT